MTNKRKSGRPASSSSYPGPHCGVSRATWYRWRKKHASAVARFHAEKAAEPEETRRRKEAKEAELLRKTEQMKNISFLNQLIESMKGEINELTRHRDALLKELVELRKKLLMLSPKHRPFRCLQEPQDPKKEVRVEIRNHCGFAGEIRHELSYDGKDTLVKCTSCGLTLEVIKNQRVRAPGP